MSNILSKQIPSIERQWWKNTQHSRRECAEVVGLPSSIENTEFEPTVFRMFQHIGVDITGKGSRQKSGMKKQSDRAIFKFSRRKDCEHIMRRKSELRKLKPSDLDLLNGTKLYINESLCRYYRYLWNQCKNL